MTVVEADYKSFRVPVPIFTNDLVEFSNEEIFQDLPKSILHHERNLITLGAAKRV